MIVSGRVQGVYYRGSTRDKARPLGLTGWVRNCPDGTVEITAEGEEEKLGELLRWCHDGPPAARVDAVDARWSEAVGDLGPFTTRY